LIFNFIFVIFKHFKSFIFVPKQIGIIIPCAILYKTNIIFFSPLICIKFKSSIFEWIKSRGSLLFLIVWFFLEFWFYKNFILMIFLKNHYLWFFSKIIIGNNSGFINLCMKL
jgi:hypothetical protein